MSTTDARKPSGRLRGSESALAQFRAGFKVRTESAANALGGNTALADYLGVNKAQLSRWTSGDSLPTTENARVLADLDYVVTRLRLVWGDGFTVYNWLMGSNSFLEGARPIDILCLRGVAPVLEAIELEIAGAYA